MTKSTSEYRGSVLWSALTTILAELTTSGEVAINTAPDYVIEHLCRELVAKKTITEAALGPRRGAGER